MAKFNMDKSSAFNDPSTWALKDSEIRVRINGQICSNDFSQIVQLLREHLGGPAVGEPLAFELPIADVEEWPELESFFCPPKQGKA